MKRIEDWIRKVIAGLFRLLHLPLSESLLNTLMQFVKFGLVGVTNTIVNYSVNVLVLQLLKPYGLSWDYVAANVVAFALSVLWSFYWNNKYVFTRQDGQQRRIGPALLRTYIAYGFTGIVLTNLLSYVWIDKLGISKYVAPLINLVINIPINFVINKFWAFGGSSDSGK